MLRLNQLLESIGRHAGLVNGSLAAIQLDNGSIAIDHWNDKGIGYLFIGSDIDACFTWVFSKDLSYFESLKD